MYCTYKYPGINLYIHDDSKYYVTSYKIISSTRFWFPDILLCIQINNPLVLWFKYSGIILGDPPPGCLKLN